MKTSTEIFSSARFVGEKKAIEYIAKAGFDAWDFTMFPMVDVDRKNNVCHTTSHPLSGDNYLSFARELRRVGEDNGIECNQSHAPFPSCVDGMEKYLIRALECTSAAGGKICIVHPDHNKSAEENAEFYMRLLPIAKDLDVKIAVENMWKWDNEKDHACPAACSHHDDFLKHVLKVDDKYLVACLDIGHAEMKGLDTSAVQMIYALKGYLQALHIHDNDKWHDSHQIPYSMDIRFEPIIKALADVGYSGYFTLECDQFIVSADGVGEKIKKLYEVVRKMADEFESYTFIK